MPFVRVAAPWAPAESSRSTSRYQAIERPGLRARPFHAGETRTQMASDKRPPITLACETCKRRNYVTTKNKTNTRDRIELSKYCKWCRQHTAHKETR